jgi:hypothetical protein
MLKIWTLSSEVSDWKVSVKSCALKVELNPPGRVCVKLTLTAAAKPVPNPALAAATLTSVDAPLMVASGWGAPEATVTPR